MNSIINNVTVIHEISSIVHATLAEKLIETLLEKYESSPGFGCDMKNKEVKWKSLLNW